MYCGSITMTKIQLVRELAALGYKIDESLSFNYVNNLNPGPAYKARACHIVEADTGISFAHYKDARRDKNFEALQAYRKESDRLIKGRIYEI